MHNIESMTIFAGVSLLQEGVVALWRGWLPSVIGVVPYVGLNFSVYETLKDVILKLYGTHIGLDYLGIICIQGIKGCQEHVPHEVCVARSSSM